VEVFRQLKVGERNRQRKDEIIYAWREPLGNGGLTNVERRVGKRDFESKEVREERDPN